MYNWPIFFSRSRHASNKKHYLHIGGKRRCTYIKGKEKDSQKGLVVHMAEIQNIQPCQALQISTTQALAVMNSCERTLKFDLKRAICAALLILIFHSFEFINPAFPS